MNALLVNSSVERDGRADAWRERRPRVLHLINSFDIGGTERQAVELLKRLDAERFDVRVAALFKRGPFYPEIAARYPTIPEFPLNSFYDANAARQLARLCALLRRERIEVLHTHGFYDGLFGALAARMAGVRVVAAQRHLRLSDRRAHEWGQRAIHKLAHRVLVNSEAVRDYIVNVNGAKQEKIVVIRNGLIVSDEAVATRREAHDKLRYELGLGRDAKIVGMVARLDPIKGHRYFLEAAARVARSFPDAHFALIGNGPLRGEIEEQISRLGLERRAHLLGDRPDAGRLVAAFDVAALSSLHEGLPNAVLEAMAAGIPVVATAVGGVTELISDGETGLLVPPANAAALAECIELALSRERESREMGERGRRFALSAFGMGRMVESVERLYGELLRSI